MEPPPNSTDVQAQIMAEALAKATPEEQKKLLATFIRTATKKDTGSSCYYSEYYALSILDDIKELKKRNEIPGNNEVLRFEFNEMRNWTPGTLKVYLHWALKYIKDFIETSKEFAEFYDRLIIKKYSEGRIPKGYMIMQVIRGGDKPTPRGKFGELYEEESVSTDLDYDELKNEIMTFMETSKVNDKLTKPKEGDVLELTDDQMLELKSLFVEVDNFGASINREKIIIMRFK